MDSPALQLDRGDAAVVEQLPMRGVGWVLRWAAALTMLAFSVLVFAAFAFQLSAEAALRQAAAAGLREAALPRSTSASVAVVVRRQLAARPRLLRATQMQLLSNGVPIRGPIRSLSSARISLSLTAPTVDVLPSSLAVLAGDSQIRVQSDLPTELR